jgi:hypothetical protein
LARVEAAPLRECACVCAGVPQRRRDRVERSVRVCQQRRE